MTEAEADLQAEVPVPAFVATDKWQRVPRHLRLMFWVLVRERRGLGSTEREVQAAAWLIVGRREAWHRRGAADAKPCPKGCGELLLWRWEGGGRAAGGVRVGIDKRGRLHACPRRI